LVESQPDPVRVLGKKEHDRLKKKERDGELVHKGKEEGGVAVVVCQHDPV